MVARIVTLSVIYYFGYRLPQRIHGLWVSEFWCSLVSLYASYVSAKPSGILNSFLALYRFDLPQSSELVIGRWKARLRSCKEALGFFPEYSRVTIDQWVSSFHLLGRVCTARFLKPLPYFRPKSAIFPTLFRTWPSLQSRRIVVLVRIFGRHLG